MPTRDEKLKIRIIGDAKSAEAAFEKARASAERSLNAVAAAAAAASAAMGALALRAIESGDTLAKTADKLGVTTKALSELRYAGELSGVSANTMDMALQRMTRRLAEAAQGSGEAKGALEELGLSAAELVRLPTDQQLARIADAMQEIPTQADRVRLAFKLFDSEGVALVNTLVDGSEGLRKAAEEARALGLSLSRIDAARMEQANDAMLRAQKAVEGVSNEIAIALSPWIVTISNQFVAWAKTGVDASKDVHGGASQVVDIFSDLADTLETIEYGWTKLGLGFSIAKAKVLDGVAAVDKKLGDLAGKNDGGSFLADTFNNLVHSIPIVGKYIDGINVKHKDLEDAATNAWTGVKQNFDNLDGLLAKEPGSDRLKKFAAEITATADAQAKIIADRARANLGTTVGGAESPAVIKAREETQKIIEEYQARYSQLHILNQANLQDELDVLTAKQIAQDEADALAREKAIAEIEQKKTDEETKRQAIEEVNRYYDELALQRAREFAAESERIEKELAKKELENEKKKAQARYALAHQVFGDLAVLMNTKSRQMFEVGKAAAIAETTIKTYEAAQEAFANAEKTGIPGAGYVAAAAAVVAGLARVQAIASTQFGSKGAGVASGGGTPNVGGGGVPVPSGAMRQAVAPAEPNKPAPQPVHVTFINPIMTEQFVAEHVVTQLQDMMENKDVTLFGPNSAQARLAAGG